MNTINSNSSNSNGSNGVVTNTNISTNSNITNRYVTGNSDSGNLMATNAGLPYYAQSLAFTLNKLKDVFDNKGKFEATRVAAYDCLAEISKIMRVLLEKYSLSRSKELLIDSRSLIAAIKQYNYTNYSPECHSDVIEAINKLYGSFHASLSNYVMDDIAMMPPATTSSSSTEPMPAAVSSLKASNDQKSSFGDNSETIPKLMSANLVDMPEERLLAHPDGMTLALDQAKLWSRYAKDLLCYLEKRTQVEIEYHRSIIKNAQYLKTTLCDGNFHLPFQDIYSNFSGHEIDNAQTSMSNFDLLTQNFLTPLNDHRLEFDKKMKKIKETWMREKKQMNETQNNFAKSRELYSSKTQELQKLKAAFKLSESNAEWTNSEKIEKKRRAIEEATIREKEAHDNYNKSILAVNSQRAHITKAQRDLILRTKDQLSMLEMKIKEVTTHYFETLTDSMTFSPAQIDKSINDTSKYEFGKSYRDYANTLPPVTTTTTNSGVGRQPGSHYGRGFKAEIDSSESDNNSPMQHVTSQPHKLTTSKTTNFPLMIECDLSSSSIENEMNAITKEFKACFESNTNSFNYENNKRKRLFGVPLMSLSTNVVPSIVRQCVEEIELNGVHMNGIYRVSGVKSKVEALCHSYETNPQSVELSNLSPNIIANVLKHFFRELPEPLMTFQLYPEFIKVAKKYASNHTVEKGDDIVGSLKKVVGRMPPVHYNTLKYLMRHLRRISHNCAVNNMPPSNLGIIFGPTLLRQNNEPNVTSSTLFDASHQGRVVELLIIYANEIFEMSDKDGDVDEEDDEDEDDDDDDDDGNAQTSQGSFVHIMEKGPYRKSSPTTSQISGGENSFRICKSATCSSIMLQSNQSKQNIVEARRQFFTSAFNAQQNALNKYKPLLVSPSNTQTTGPMSYINRCDNGGLSPFSAIAASSSSNSSNQPGYKIKRLTSSNYHQSMEMPNKIYGKNNELSKSSSSIYSLKNNLSVITGNEDHV